MTEHIEAELDIISERLCALAMDLQTYSRRYPKLRKLSQFVIDASNGGRDLAEVVAFMKMEREASVSGNTEVMKETTP